MLSRRVALPRVAFLCAGLIVLAPLADCPTCQSADPPAAQPKAKKARRPRRPLLPNSLVGRITDEKGAPVADAQLQIYPKDGGAVYQAKTKADGTYAIERVASTAVYHLTISSTRCVGLNDYQDDRLDIPLDPPQTVTRDFVLKRACQLRLTVVDEDGHPIPKVTVYKPGRFDNQFRRTDKAGQVTVGMPPAALPVRFALRHDDFAIEPVDVKLDDPDTIVERTVTLTPGKSVQGTVMCSDGKPAFGCRIVPQPSWWDFTVWPGNGQPIQADGSFVLPHIGPGAYKLSIFVPKGKNSSIVMNLLSDANLLNRKEPLALKGDFPSPASLGFIAGRIHYKGNRRPKRGFWINANSPGAAFLGANQYVQPDENSFKITALAAGRYRLSIESQEIEAKELVGIATGTDNLELELEVRGPLSLKGLVTGEDGGVPLKDLRIRLFKTRYLRGPNYGVDQQWHTVADPKGKFSIDIPGPGVYVVEASADGYAIGKSEPANSDTDLAKSIRVKLSRGLSVSGRVVDEAGRPIDGATVLAKSLVGKALPVSVAKVPAGAGVSTKDGRFSFEHLNPGPETFRALHPDYAYAEIRDVEIKAGAAPAPLTITLKRGGTVRGRVFNENGRPAAGISLRFSDSQHNDYQGTGEFASGISDEAGEFEVAHLPESLVYISRGNEWDSLGVVRQAVLPSAGKTLRADFGGIKKVTGRLLVNGVPVAKTKVVLSGDNAYSGSLKAFAITDADGNFVFRGIPPGERWLYYSIGKQRRQQWVRVRPLRVETSNDAFGTIELVTGTLTVHLASADPVPLGGREVYVGLSHYDPVWFSQGFGINSAPRQDKKDPFIFRDVPVGKYVLGVSRHGKLGIRQVIEIAGRGEKSITIDWPQGTASLRGKVAADKPESRRFLQLRSKDNRLLGYIEIQPDGGFHMDGLPAGDYFFTQQQQVEAKPLVAFSLAAGEKKTVSIPEAALRAENPSNGLLVVKPYTAEGLPLPGCKITLTGAKGDIVHRPLQSAQVSFTATPGPYRLSVSYPGFAPVTKQVDVRASHVGRAGQENELTVILVRTTEKATSEIH